MGSVGLYAADALGAYGWDDKPWYRPGERQAAFLAALEAAGLADALVRCEAPPASDADLCRFHCPEHVSSVVARCAANRGSLDRHHPLLVDDARRLLAALASGDALPAVAAPTMTTEAHTSWLATLGLLADAPGGPRITDAGRAWLADPARSLPGPTPARAAVERAARHVCGAVLDATRRILAGELRAAFVPIAGFHHAHRSEARLYCLYNDPALAIAAALDTTGGPVAYVDVDVHQGDGVYEGFADDPRVVIADVHEDWGTLFPWTPEHPSPTALAGGRDATGRGAGAGSKHNRPLAPGTDDDGWLAAWHEVEPHLRAARPRFVVFEAGADGLVSDPMSHQGLTVAGLAALARRVRALADDCAGGRLLVLGGGGYAQPGTAEAWVAVVRTLLG